MHSKNEAVSCISFRGCVSKCEFMSTVPQEEKLIIYLCFTIGIGCHIWFIPNRIPILKSGLA